MERNGVTMDVVRAVDYDIASGVQRISAHGNQRSEWDLGCRLDVANPEQR